jgi:hypothetical protein
MLKMQKLSFLWLILMVIVGCEPNLNTQQITQGAQNLRENVRNIDTQKITQGAQNLRENVRNIDTQKIAQGAQNLKENLQNFAGSSAAENKSSNPTPESLKNTDPVLAEILGDVLADDQVQVDQTKQIVEELDTTRLSDENDFDAVSERQSIESDAERIEKNRALYVLIEPTSLPRRPGSKIPSIVEYAIKTTNPVGMQLYSRPFASATRFEWNCGRYSSQSAAQEAFLVKGGPRFDSNGLDPDGDGFACYWDPEPFRRVLKEN